MGRGIRPDTLRRLPPQAAYGLLLPALRRQSPSCRKKRAEILCRFVIDEVIEPAGHRQMVFVLPRHLRRPFYRDRKLLTGLCRSVVEVTHKFYQTGLGRDDLRVGLVVVPQRFGDRVNPHLHLHALAADGAFDDEGVFHSMPCDAQGDIEVLERLFARRGDRFEDYTHAVRNLARDDRFPESLVRELEPLPGFRNVLVLEHAALDMDRVVDALDRLGPLRTFAEIVRRQLSGEHSG